jgi:hypothetical protein
LEQLIYHGLSELKRLVKTGHYRIKMRNSCWIVGNLEEAGSEPGPDQLLHLVSVGKSGCAAPLFGLQTQGSELHLEVGFRDCHH